ncbi:hypothetical protein QR680_014986 [Steinernema hermaphroditum]|uniref:CHK kinase-like domain-containing protein n=1 Tax=Steinernema hermaphroditum TaxID=289476 RepID=A0AA39M561_9BILA|nr:hypothetical protein QR680_014986 [Steinernema hermaphroditum]
MLSVVSPSLNVSEQLADSSFTIEWVLSHLLEADNKFTTLTEGAKVKNVTAVDISGGKGFASKVYKVTIEFDNISEPYFVVLKVPGTESFSEAMGTNENTIKEQHLAANHNKECDFYTNFSSHINAPLPKIYKVQHWIVGEQPGAILMESFFGKAVGASQIADSNIEQAYEVVRQLASIQAYFLSLPAEQWHNKLTIVDDDSKDKNLLIDIFLAKLKEMRPGMFDEGIGVLSKYAQQRKFLRYTLCDVYEDVGLPLGISHGDFGNHNVLWKANPDGSISNELAAIIDWQTVHEGCLTNDLARFMALCLNSDARRQHEDGILKTYYDTLVRLLKKEGQEVTFTLDQVIRGYRANFVGQSLFTLLCGPFRAGLKECDEKELEIYMVRAKMTMEDGLERLKELPEEKLLD